MINFVEAVIIIFLILIIYKYVEKKTYDVVYVKSNINGRTYLVRNLPDKQQAADLLARMSGKLERLVDVLDKSNSSELYDKYIKTDITNELYTTSEGAKNTPDINSAISVEVKQKLANDIKRLVNNFNPDNFSETTPDSKYTSYSVNKGEKIVFCLRDRNQDESLVKENIMMFVSIHELGHLMTQSVGHEPDFWNNFKFLLQVAIDNGLYEYIDFNTSPKNYCGTKITDTPLKL